MTPSAYAGHTSLLLPRCVRPVQTTFDNSTRLTAVQLIVLTAIPDWCGRAAPNEGVSPSAVIRTRAATA